MEIRAAVRRHGHEPCSQALRVFFLNRLPSCVPADQISL